LIYVKGILVNILKLAEKISGMKKVKIIYWVTTGLVATTMLYTAFSYFIKIEMKDSFERLGFPDFFRVELGIAKGLGALVLLLPFLPTRLKEAAYVGFAITFVSATVAHLSNGDPLNVTLQAVTLLGILTASYFYFRKVRKLEGSKDR
jgi:VIT1/CCC1 family predicted Fe2+/Mn2+ transporter